MRSLARLSFVALALFGCDATVGGTAEIDPHETDCRACINPDQPGCDGCIFTPGAATEPVATPLAAAAPAQIVLTQDALSFAIVGDTRPAIVNDTGGYPTSIITKIFQDIQAESPRPGFAVATGDYQFSSVGSSETGPQLDLYLGAKASYSNPLYPTMGNHECTGYTSSNCGAGNADGMSSVYTSYLSKVLAPLGVSTPYYSLLVKPSNNAWSAKIVFVAANAWNSAQASWLDSVLAQPSTYTFIVRHEASTVTSAPGVKPSNQIIAAHPYTMLLVGHDHLYKHVSQKEVIDGIGGAPLTSGSSYGYGVATRRNDGAIQLTFYHYKTHATLGSFAVNADGSPAGTAQGTFSLAANPTSVTSSGAAATSTISLTALSGFSGTATLSVSGIPSGAQGSLATSQLGGGGSTKLTLTPGTAAGGAYSVKVTGVANGESESATVAWTINGPSTCAHDRCLTGSKLTSSCNACVAQICAQDSYCCKTYWDGTCVAEVGTICGETCN